MGESCSIRLLVTWIVTGAIGSMGMLGATDPAGIYFSHGLAKFTKVATCSYSWGSLFVACVATETCEGACPWKRGRITSTTFVPTGTCCWSCLLDSASKAMWTTDHLGIASSSLNALVWDGGLFIATTIESKLGTCCYHRGSSSHVLMWWTREKARVQSRGKINLDHLNSNWILLQNLVVQQQGCCYHHNHLRVSNSSLNDLDEDGVFTLSWGRKTFVMHTHFM